MARLIFSLLARSSSVDRNTNSLSIFNVVEEITGIGERPEVDEEDVPYLPIDCTFLMLWARDDFDVPETDEIRIWIQTPDGRHLAGVDYMVDLTTYKRVRVNMGMQGIPYTEPGEYDFIVERKLSGENEKEEWGLVSVTPVEISITEPGTDNQP